MYKSEVHGKGNISAKVVADSISNNIRLTTLELCYPRFIHAEMLTHRVFSRNASSSRAIPVEKMLKQVRENPAMPIHWGANKPGMQASKEILDDFIEEVKDTWYSAALDASSYSSDLSILYSIHKQVANRLLEPFQFIKVVVTATEFSNFFALRMHPAAQPEIQELATCMKGAMYESIPQELKPGAWHIPYVDLPGPRGKELNLEDAIKASVARCARVSYMNHDNTNPDIEKDIELYNQLITRPYTDKRGFEYGEDEPIHASPCEHQATPMTKPNTSNLDINNLEWPKGATHFDINGNLWSGNLRGWVQNRQLLGT